MITRIGPGSLYHTAVKHAGTIYLSGVVGQDLQAGIEDQARSALARLDAALQLAGSDRSKVLSATIYLVNMDDKPGMNTVWQEHFAPGELPARATVAVADLGPGVLIEISATAAR